MFRLKMLPLWLAAVLGVFGLPRAADAQRWLHGMYKQAVHAGGTAHSRSAPKHAAAAQAGRRYEGRVTDVHDGDTVRLTDTDGRRHKIRLAYIDAPETDQAYGLASRDRLRGLILGRTVQVRVTDTDQYGREVAYLFSDGLDVNRSQIESGAAWHYVSIAKRQQDKADYAAYAEAESQARRSRSGLWCERSPTAPWKFRHQTRGQ